MKRYPSIALVACGGACRGLAHLGVLRACETLGIVPDVFVGTNLGALVGVAWAQGVSLDLGTGLSSYSRSLQPLHLSLTTLLGAPSVQELCDPGLLLSGVFSTQRLERWLRQRLPINDFRRLHHPVMIVTADLDRGKPVVFGTGHLDTVPISQALAASCCTPGLFRPYRIGGAYYLDGELVHSLPVDLAAHAGADIVVVSRVRHPTVVTRTHRSMARRGALGVMRQALDLVLEQNERMRLMLYAQNHPQIVLVEIAPSIGAWGAFSEARARAVVMRSYRSALGQLAQAKASGLLGHIPARRTVHFTASSN